MATEHEIAEQHLLACDRFGRAVVDATGRWDANTPCPEWNARSVVEHLIGFHDALLLRPLGAKPDRPRDHPELRWTLTYDALRDVFERPGLFERIIEVPAVGNNPPTQLDLRRLVPGLTQDVLVHTWDLARAVGADDRLDPDLCARAIRRLPDDPGAMIASGMFGPPVDVAANADPQTRLLARLGRDPSWEPPVPP